MQTPVLGEQVARHNHPFLQRLSLRFLSRRGWRISGTLPNLPKMILLGAPHTSNWDFIYSMAFMYATGFSASWIGKESLFKWPFSGMMRRLGGIPVNRRFPASFLRITLAKFRENEKFILAIAPEGTRSKVDRWKPGFYRIAKAANVPMVGIGFDFGARMFRISEPFMPTGDMEADIRAIQEFYVGVVGKRPR